ncbi:MAG: putative oxidoreductase [Candidatus Marinamargulisbacteria bacterium]|jgi:putative oxidoreductase
MNNLKNYVPILGRALFTFVFLSKGLNHIAQMKPMARYAAQKGVIFPEFAVILTGIMLLVGGMSVLTGYKAKKGALILLAFLVPVTIIMHNPAHLSGLRKQIEIIMIMKNAALAGACLLIAHFGSGPGSLDDRKSK